jgi:predicted ArsR family transcriptional regulator
MLGHCPYRSILDEHPELCRMDRLLLGNMLGMSVSQIDKQLTNRDGIAECSFLVEAPPY